MPTKYQHQNPVYPRELMRHIKSQLIDDAIEASWLQAGGNDGIRGSAVLFLLTYKRFGPSKQPELCVLLNKRSQQVLQPGDLCCPGGGVQAPDKILSPLMWLPFGPLAKWAPGALYPVRHHKMAFRMAVLSATGLREAWEEIRLNPLKVIILGPLPVQKLILFERRIFPLAAWVQPHQWLRPNWEVDRIVYVPLRRMLDPGNFGRYRLTFNSGRPKEERKKDFPCFIYCGRRNREILWGATFRIAIDFLKRVFGFNLPDINTLPVIRGERGRSYLNGSLWEQSGDTGAEDDEAY